MASVYDDTQVWWLKALGERLGDLYESGVEIVGDAKEVASDIWGSMTDTEQERAKRQQNKLDKEQMERQAIADLTPGPADPGIWYEGGTYKPTDQYRRVLQGPFGKTPLAAREPQQAQGKKPATSENDWLNQLLMASLMQGQKRQYGRQAGLGYGVGAQVPFGDPYTMRAAWEKDYRNI